MWGKKNMIILMLSFSLFILTEEKWSLGARFPKNLWLKAKVFFSEEETG